MLKLHYFESVIGISLMVFTTVRFINHIYCLYNSTTFPKLCIEIVVIPIIALW